jgi:porin
MSSGSGLRRPAALAMLAATVAGGAAARAQTVQTPATPPSAGAAAPEPSGFADLFSSSRTNLLDDIGGVRTTLGNYGISLGLQETSEVLGNVTGGVHTGADYDGVTEMSLGLDTEKAFGWAGGTFNISAFQIHGRDLSADNLYVLQIASSIEAEDATRLWELWYQQSFLNGTADIKVGQQSIDQEFMVSQYSSLFINSVMGFPALPTVDMYAGGPEYPLSSLGVRLRGRPLPGVTLLGGVFDDNPPGGPFNNDPQTRGAEASGAAFNLNTGALWLGKIQYAINQPAADGTPATTGLPGTYKLGFWYDSGAFLDQHYDTSGLSLANPASNGMPRMHQGNYSVYAVADQMVWRPDPKWAQALGVFARVMGAPPDRNLVSFSADAGATLAAPLPGRDNDTFGVGFGVAKVSSADSALDRDIGLYTNTNYPVRTVETFFEVTYQFQIAPWWQVQPDFQYFLRPSGGIPNPLQPNELIGNEAVFGLRTVVTF